MDREKVIVIGLLVFVVLVFLAFKFRPVDVEVSSVNCVAACNKYFCVGGYYDSYSRDCFCEPEVGKFVNVEQMLFFYTAGFAC